MVRCLGLVLIPLLVATAAWAGDEDGPPIRPAAAADEVLAAVRAADTEALERIARRAQPDPWLVADILIGRGEHDAAAAFAKATQGSDVAKLSDHVADRRDKPDDTASRKAFVAWRDALAARDEPAWRAALQGVKPDLATVIGVYVASLQVIEMRGRVSEGRLRASVAQASDAALELGWTLHAARIVFEDAYHAYRSGDYTTAVGQYRRVLEIQELREDAEGIALASHNLGNALNNVGALGEAERAYKRALELRKAAGDTQGQAASLIDLAAIYRKVGAAPQAHATYERGIALAEKIGHKPWLANALEGYAHLFSDEGDDERARKLHRRALKLRKEGGDRLHIASSLHNLGVVETALGHHARAQENLQEALELRVAMRHRSHVAQTLIAIGMLRRAEGRFDEAFGAYDQVRQLHQRAGDRLGAAFAQCTQGAVLADKGAHDEALALLEKTAEEARSLRNVSLTVTVHTELARVQLLRREFASAANHARIGLNLRPWTSKGRSQVLAIGAAAAIRKQDAESALFFLESGRARALLEHVTAREALLAVVVPEELAKEETAARVAATAAATRAAEARRGTSLKELRTRTLALRDARARLHTARLRIYAHAGRSAQVLAPQPTGLETLQGQLSGGQAFVLYGVHEDDVLALVVTSKRASTLTVGSVTQVEGLVKVLSASEDEALFQASFVALRKQLVAPLALDATVTQVLVSPVGALWRVAPGFLFERPAAFVPSATTFVTLRTLPHEAGKGVLAIGDPSSRDSARGRRLPRLPATGPEAKAVGDVVLLRKDATRARLLTGLAARPRWRALHFAGHASVDMREPTYSGLFLTSTADDAGFLSLVDVLRMDVRADLVALSADRSARGPVRQGEGLLCLPRAFLMAGARQVLGSLGHVDDASAMALMTKFYELWNPKDGAGIGPAEALFQAQAHIRSQPEWKHPRFWSNWVLYGLPD